MNPSAIEAYRTAPAPAPARVVPVVQPKRSTGWRGTIVGILVIGALVVGGYFLYERFFGPHAKDAAAAGQARARPPAPVTIATARQEDVPIYLNGMGSVTPFNTVVVHTRVDGELMDVPFTEGQVVNKDDLIAQVDPAPFTVQLHQAEAQHAKDAAMLKEAQLDLQRFQQAGQFLTQQQLDAQTAVVSQDEAALQSDQAQIDSANLQLKYARITAPISGRLGLRLMDKGNMVHAGDASGLVVITQVQPIAVVFTIPQDQIAQVMKKYSAGQKLEVEAWDRDIKTKLATGTLLAVDNQVDATTGTVKIKASFDNEDGSLFPNEFVNARLLVDTRQAATVVPAAAVQRGPDNGTFVYVLNDQDNTVSARDVTIGPSEGDRQAIESGISVGMKVVTDGVDKLQDGVKVQPRGPTTAPSRPARPDVAEADAPREAAGRRSRPTVFNDLEASPDRRGAALGRWRSRTLPRRVICERLCRFNTNTR